MNLKKKKYESMNKDQLTTFAQKYKHSFEFHMKSKIDSTGFIKLIFFFVPIVISFMGKMITIEVNRLTNIRHSKTPAMR